MNISLVVNFEKENSKTIAWEVVELLAKHNVSVFTNSQTAELINNNHINIVDDIMSACDMLVVIGGDGTIIHTAKKATQFDKPVLGINSGRIGYLAALKCDELDMISKIVTGEYFTEERIMLSVDVESKAEKKEFVAFNDAVICKGAISRMIDIDLTLDNHSLRYRADGLIVSTPTGSSAYSLSAGGPLLDPRLDNLLITPICPYTYLNKAMVIPSSTDMEISVDTDGGKEAYLTIDGEVAVKIFSGDKIRIRRSNTTVKLVRLKSESIFKRLEAKILQEVNK